MNAKEIVELVLRILEYVEYCSSDDCDIDITGEYRKGTIQADEILQLRMRLIKAEKERYELKHQLERKEEQCKACAALCAAKMQCEELKAKLEEKTKRLAKVCAHDINGTCPFIPTNERLVAAERCIEDVAKAAFYKLKAEYLVIEDVQNVIRAYRAAKEEK